MPVVVVATITPLPEHRDAVREALLGTVPAVHAEDGCQLYALHEDAGHFIMIEQWASEEALAVHSRGPALTALGPQLAGRVKGAPALMLLGALPAGEHAKGQLVP